MKRSHFDLAVPKRWLCLLVFFAAVGAIGCSCCAASDVIEGLAARYEGDGGIEGDSHVVFVEDFEAESLEAIGQRWESVKNAEIMSLSKDIPGGSGGSSSLLMRHVGGRSTGAHLYRRLPPGYDQLYVRFYVKFDPDCWPIHHFVHVGGYNPPTAWPQGGAGIRPKGDKRFTTGVEPYGENWRWDFYSYWMGMRSSPDNHSWGHDFINDPGLRAVKGQWQCVELMMKMNDPVTASNGEQAIWIDGRPWVKDGQVISHLGPGFPKGKWVWDSFIPDTDGEPFEGFQWRDDEDLKLNFLWLLLYITKAPAGHVSKVWFDHIVVATEYIGPMGRSGSERSRRNRTSGESSSAAMKNVRIAICQIEIIDGDRAGNLGRVEEAIVESRRAGAHIACFPEMALFGWVNPEAHEKAQPIPGRDSEHLCELAKRYGVHLCIGLAEKEGAKLYDSVILIGDDGRILGKHRKMNILRDLMTPPYTAGDEIDVVETTFGKVGLLICADTHREDILDRMAALKPELLLVPYGYAAKQDAWPGHGEELASVVCNAAKNTGAYCIGPNSIGAITHGPWTGMTYGGQSIAAAPTGRIVARGRDRQGHVLMIDVPVAAGGS